MAEKLRFKVEGMDCASCAQTIRKGVSRVPGVSDVNISTTTETLTLMAESGTAEPIEKVIRQLGYRPSLISPRVAAASGVGSGGRDADEHRGHDHAPGAAHDHDHDHGDADGHKHAENDGHKHGENDGHDHGAGTAKHGAGDGHKHEDGDDHGAPIEGAWWRSGKGQLVLLSGALVAIAFVAAYIFPTVAYPIYLAACAVAGFPVATHAFRAARHGSIFTIEMLMTIAVIGAVAIGAAEEAAIVVFLFAVGELLEGVAAGRARAGIKALANIAPKTALLETANGLVETPIERIAVGATVVVRAGDRVPADGTVLSGASSLDESALTGESMPRSKGEGDAVLAGSINQEATLRVRVDKPATETLIARVVKLVEEAAESKAPSERFIDEFSRYYMPAICLLALGLALIPPIFAGQPWDVWIYRALTLLLIGCPCALVISTPATIASALAAGARRGLLVKGGAVMEQIGKVKHIAFDKTGTLTEGKPKVTDVVPLATVDEAGIIGAAAAIGRESSHPLSVSVAAYAGEKGIAVPAADKSAAIPGKGIRGMVGGQEVVVGAAARLGLDATTIAASEKLEREGKSVSTVVVGGKPIGLIALRDEPRADAKSALASIRSLGVTTVMLTGDNKATGDAIGNMLGIETRSELLPQDKLDIVKRLAVDGGVAQVGDGINDAPALAAATVGIAMGSGTDVALEAGDAAILRNRMSDVASLVRLSRRTMEIVRQNIFIALGLKAIFLVTTVFGFTGLWIAVLADTGATVIVTGNALRLLGWREEDKSAK